MYDEKLARRFWSKVAISEDPQHCWEWTRYRNTKGYGRFRIGIPALMAHRVAWELTNGEIPDGSLVLHRCDNPPCCNPHHLFLGTSKDNSDDMYAKGREAPAKVRRGPRKLTPDQIEEIKERYQKGKVGYKTLAKEYGVSRTHIYHIVKNIAWTL